VGRPESQHEQLRRFALAAWDMEQAASAARFLYDERLQGFHALEAGMIVCYARPFTESKWFRPLGRRWRPKDASSRKLHRRLIELRKQWAAHTDEPSGRNVERFREVLWDGTNDLGEMAEEAGVTNAVMMEWLSKHYVSVAAGIRREALPGILALCELQEQRFRSEWRRLERECPPLAEP
jgi:hypothetical protein